MDINQQQKLAIEHDKGPLLIIAGAGTGKTCVITSKILHLIQNNLAKNEEILALTFTDKAANEMLERIDIAMPLGYEELCVKTFHAFSDQILRESGMEIGIDPGYKILTQVEQWFFFKKNLFAFDLDYYRPLGNPNRFIYALLNHFNKLKDELIKPESYIEYAQKLTAKPPGTDQASSENALKVQEIARVYQQYQELLLKNNYLDFADLSFYANKLLEKRSSCLKKYQNKYKYILVDEFQDTNYSQFQLVLKLVKEPTNITVVGDDDQSIYKWRGASLSNMLQFENHFKGAENIVLTENYRSGQSVLDAAYDLIQNNNPDRLEVKLGIQKKLQCNVKENEPVEVVEFNDFLEESKFVAEKIKSLHEKEHKDFNEFAILVRANSYANPFIDELRACGLPFQVKNPKGLLALDEIKDLVAMIRTTANPFDDVSLLRFLKLPNFNLKMVEILNLLNHPSKAHLFGALKSKNNQIHRLIMDLIEFSKNHAVGLVINKFLNETKYLHNLIEKEKFEELENINEFAKQIARFEKENEQNSATDFVNYLELLEEANAVFALETPADRNSVQILTAHGAKGLEFEYVFIVNAVKGRFPTVNRSEPFEIPKELTNEIYPEGDFHLQEERRLFYVAMTRAKKNLFITYSNQYEGSKKWQVSPFVTEVIANSAVRFTKQQSEQDAIARLKQFKEIKEPIFTLPPFTDKKLSFTKFDTFNTCPLKYNYRYLMNVPVADSHAGNFGSSVHCTLKDFYRLIKQESEVNMDILRRLYEKNWISAGYESPEHEKIRKEKGFEVLEDFYQKNKDPWVVPAYLERPFNIKIEEFLINGRIDRIDKLKDGTYEVIDYKTGRKGDQKEVDKSLQLSIYALACRDIFKIPVSKLSFYYLEDNEKIESHRSDNDLEKSKAELLKLIADMQNSDFKPTPGFHCQFCDFRLICPAV